MHAEFYRTFNSRFIAISVSIGSYTYVFLLSYTDQCYKTGAFLPNRAALLSTILTSRRCKFH